jgi:hypothetical protein
LLGVVALAGCGAPGASDGTEEAISVTEQAATQLTAWKPGLAVKVGDQVAFAGMTFRARQAHTAQTGWEPPNVFALWSRIVPAGVWAPQVIYRGTEVGNPEFVFFLGHRYSCIQGHQALANWSPPTVPALWKLVE